LAAMVYTVEKQFLMPNPEKPPDRQPEKLAKPPSPDSKEIHEKKFDQILTLIARNKEVSEYLKSFLLQSLKPHSTDIDMKLQKLKNVKGLIDDLKLAYFHKWAEQTLPTIDPLESRSLADNLKTLTKMHNDYIDEKGVDIVLTEMLFGVLHERQSALRDEYDEAKKGDDARKKQFNKHVSQFRLTVDAIEDITGAKYQGRDSFEREIPWFERK
jgi:hypothetical protein